MPNTWTKLPPDGTNTSYWERDDGWRIETKPRFHPLFAHELNASPAFRQAAGGAWPLQFFTLADAKAAADWPREQLLDRMREEYEDYQAVWAKGVTCAGPESTLERVHADALEEHAQFPTRFLQPWINDVEAALHAFREASGGGQVVYSSPFEGVVLPLGTVARLHKVVLLSDDPDCLDFNPQALPLFILTTDEGAPVHAYTEEVFPQSQTPEAVDAFCHLMGQVCGAFRVSRSHAASAYEDPLQLATEGSAEHLRVFREARAAESVLSVADLAEPWGVGCFYSGAAHPRTATALTP
jgi:hypothetical protein